MHLYYANNFRETWNLVHWWLSTYVDGNPSHNSSRVHCNSIHACRTIIWNFALSITASQFLRWMLLEVRYWDYLFSLKLLKRAEWKYLDLQTESEIKSVLSAFVCNAEQVSVVWPFNEISTSNATLSHPSSKTMSVGLEIHSPSDTSKPCSCWRCIVLLKFL